MINSITFTFCTQLQSPGMRMTLEEDDTSWAFFAVDFIKIHSELILIVIRTTALALTYDIIFKECP